MQYTDGECALLLQAGFTINEWSVVGSATRMVPGTVERTIFKLASGGFWLWGRVYADLDQAIAGATHWKVYR